MKATATFTEKTKTVGFVLPISEVKKLDSEAKARGVSVSAILRSIYLKEKISNVFEHGGTVQATERAASAESKEIDLSFVNGIWSAFSDLQAENAQIKEMLTDVLKSTGSKSNNSGIESFSENKIHNLYSLVVAMAKLQYVKEPKISRKDRFSTSYNKAGDLVETEKPISAACSELKNAIDSSMISQR